MAQGVISGTLQTNTSHEHNIKFLNKVSAKRIKQYIQRIINYDQVRFNPRNARLI